MQLNNNVNSRFRPGERASFMGHRYMLMVQPQLKILENKIITIKDIYTENNCIYYSCVEYPDLKIPESQLHPCRTSL